MDFKLPLNKSLKKITANLIYNSTFTLKNKYTDACTLVLYIIYMHVEQFYVFL